MRWKPSPDEQNDSLVDLRPDPRFLQSLAKKFPWLVAKDPYYMSDWDQFEYRYIQDNDTTPRLADQIMWAIIRGSNYSDSPSDIFGDLEADGFAVLPRTKDGDIPSLRVRRLKEEKTAPSRGARRGVGGEQDERPTGTQRY